MKPSHMSVFQAVYRFCYCPVTCPSYILYVQVEIQSILGYIAKGMGAGKGEELQGINAIIP